MIEEVTILGNVHHIIDAYDRQTFKLEVLARMLAGYDEKTWDKLSSSRKRTYKHAASNVFFGWKDFKTKMEEWNAEV